MSPLPVLADRYAITAELGHGGMGAVYRAMDRQLGREVAVKVILADVSAKDEYLQRFRREVRACAALSHPNIVRILDFGAAGQRRLYYVMELLEAASLQQLIDDRGALPADEVVALMAQAADALSFVHERGMIHRDVKPANLMVDRHGHLTVMDFGLAKVEGRTLLTAEGELLGTPRYLPPEAIGSAPPAPALDIYCLGVTFWEAVAGVYAFSGGSTSDLLRWILTAGPAPLRQLRPGTPDWLARLIHRMVSRDPALRPTAAEAAAVCRAGGLEVASTPARSTRKAARVTRPVAVKGATAPGGKARVVVLAAAVALCIAAAAFIMKSGGRSGPDPAARSPSPLTSAAPRFDPADVEVEWSVGVDRVAASVRRGPLSTCCLEVLSARGVRRVQSAPGAARRLPVRLEVDHLEPDQPYEVTLTDGSARKLAGRALRTLSMKRGLDRVVTSLREVDPYSLTRGITREIEELCRRPATPARERALQDSRRRWEAAIGASIARSRLEATVQLFAPVKDLVYGDRSTDRTALLALYQLTTELKELEETASFNRLRAPRLAERLFCVRHGQADRSAISGDRGLACFFRALTSPTPFEDAIRRSPDCRIVAVDAPDLFQALQDPRDASAGSAFDFGATYTHPVPLPAPPTGGAGGAEIRAVIHDLSPRTAFRVLVAGESNPASWRLLALLRPRSQGPHTVYHSVAPAVLVGGPLRFRVELAFDNSWYLNVPRSAEMRGYLPCLQFAYAGPGVAAASGTPASTR